MCKLRFLVLILIVTGLGISSNVFSDSLDNYFRWNKKSLNLSIEEYEGDFWAFFLDLDPKVYEKVIKGFLSPDRSKKDNVAGVKATISLLRKHNEILPTSIVERIVSDEEFLNALIWKVDDLSLKEYALKLILLDIGINDDIVADVFSKYKDVNSLTNNDESLLENILLWYIRDQRSFINNTRMDYSSRAFGRNSLRNNLEEISFIVKDSAWGENNSKFKKNILDIIKTEPTAETEANALNNLPTFNLKYANTFPELQDALNANQVLELRKMILTKNSSELYDIFDRIDNFNLKADIIRFTLSNVQKEQAFNFVERIIDMYYDFDYLEMKDRSLLHITLANARYLLNNDQLIDVVINLENSLWFGNIAGEDIMALQLGVLSSLKADKNNNVLIHWKKLMNISIIHYHCSRGLLTALSNLELDLSPTSFQKDVKTIFNAYRDVKNLTTHDVELLSIILSYVNSLNDESITNELLDTIEGSLWLNVDNNANNEKLKSKVQSLKQSGCILKFKK